MKKNNRLIYLLIIILVIWNVVLTVVYVNNKQYSIEHTSVNETTVTGFSTDLTKVVESSKAGVVVVETNMSLSSGIVYKYDNGICYIVTTAHSVADASSISVVFASGATYDASLLDKDNFADIAVLKVETNVEIAPIILGDSELLKDGEFLTCIGTPKNTQYAFSNELAVVSSKLRTITNSITFDDNLYEYYTSIIQLSSNVAEGYSGAPIINMNGEVVGLITMKDANATFALPINEIVIVANNIINETEYNKIQLGVKGLFVNELEMYEKTQLNIPLDVNNGFYVNGVKVTTLASNMGVKQGDVILSINGLAINSYNDLLAVEYSEATSFDLEIVRSNEIINLVGSIND
ncbi:MAG: trypsin-like peptidase domain-containing protein [Erysipelotrichaceae bacterium]|nr:trypsin-like peptidase domain-containing protein [Erysipelotrichaceae bacterium]